MEEGRRMEQGGGREGRRGRREGEEEEGRRGREKGGRGREGRVRDVSLPELHEKHGVSECVKHQTQSTVKW